MKVLTSLTIAVGVLCATALLETPNAAHAANGPVPWLQSKKKVKYVGAKLCKNCHNRKDNGHAYDIWAASPHANAWKALASDKAKEFGKKVGIANPQKSDKCVQCHVTAFGVSKKLAKRIKPKDGVQCEVCHGPGGNHVSKRMAAAAMGDVDPAKVQKLTKGEIIAEPGPSTCLKCHNDKSPSYKPFCFKEFMAKIRHLDPRRKRTKAELEKLENRCYPECPKCKKAKKEDKKEGK